MTEQTPIPDDPGPPPPAIEAPAAPEPAAAPAGPEAGPRWRLPFPWWGLLAAAVGGVLLAYVTGMLIVHKIDDDPLFGTGPVAVGQSRTVAVAAGLIHREVDVHGWTPNDPFFMPSWALDDMPSYQMGLVAALARFTGAMAEVGGNPEVERAAGLLRYSGTTWMFDPRAAWSRTASAEKMYRNAQRLLEAYNEKLAAGSAGFERRPAALSVLLAAVARDLEETSETLGRHIDEGHFSLLDFQADNLYYAAKGRLYAYALLLRELGADAAPVIQGREQGAAWGAMVDAFRAAARLDPLVVVNAAPDALLLPSHLAAQAFMLERARIHTVRLAEALRK